MKEKVDVCVVGGGVIGLFCALEQARLGRTVRIIDKLYAGSNRYHIGDILLQGFSKEILPFATFSHSRWKEAYETWGKNLGYTPCGGIKIACNAEELSTLAHEVKEEQTLNFNSALITQRDVLQEMMQINQLPDTLLGAKYSADDASIHPHKALEGLKQLVIQQGVRIWGSDEVVSFERKENIITGVQTDAGDICTADHIILATGVWSSNLLKLADIFLPTRPARVHILEMIPTGAMPPQTIDHQEKDGRIILKHLSTGRSLVTYTAEMDQAQATWDLAPHPDVIHWLKKRAGEMIPSLHHAEHVKTHVTTIDITPDGMPYIGKVPHQKHLYTAFGMNGKCYALAAGTAHYLATLTNARKPEADIPQKTYDAIQPSANRFLK